MAVATLASVLKVSGPRTDLALMNFISAFGWMAMYAGMHAERHSASARPCALKWSSDAPPDCSYGQQPTCQHAHARARVHRAATLCGALPRTDRTCGGRRWTAAHGGGGALCVCDVPGRGPR